MKNFYSNRTSALITILILAIGSVSVMGMTHMVRADQKGKVCVFFACGNTDITGPTSSGGGGQPTPSTATLIVTKECAPAQAACRPQGFEITVSGNNPSPSTVHDDGIGTPVTLGPGAYKVSETPPTDFSVSFSGDCNASGVGNINGGETQHCKVTNTLQTATLTVTKEVVCSASSACPKPEDFTIKITGSNPSPSSVNDDGTGTKVTIGPGDFAVGEDPTTGFQISFSGDCDGKISAGETKKCTVTNTQTAKLIVSKVIDLSEVGFCSPAAVGCKASDYGITVTGNNPQPSSFQGSDTGTEVTLLPGQYKVTEAFLSPNDHVSFSGDGCQQDSAGSLSASGSINGGETKHCTITNKFVLPG